tara:strand:- start:2646 stop:3818 length:1173 start_codon:yes stop_codon:yes gene_type:complete
MVKNAEPDYANLQAVEEAGFPVEVDGQPLALEEAQWLAKLIEKFRADGLPDPVDSGIAIMRKGRLAGVMKTLQTSKNRTPSEDEPERGMAEDAPLETVTLRGVEIFEVGEYENRGQWSDDDVEQIVESTNEVLDKVKPYVKLGHNESQPLTDGQPALGWLSNIRKVGRKIVSDISDVPKALAKVVEKGGYRRVSVELMPNRTFGDKTFPWLIRAIAFLGADMPVVKTLGDLPKLYYGEGDEESLTVTFNHTEDEVTTEEAKALEAECTAMKEQLAETETKLSEAQDALGVSRKEKLQAGADAFAERLLNENRIRTEDKEKWAEVLFSVDLHAQEVVFAEDEKSFSESLKDLLTAMPKMAEEDELAGAEEDKQTEDDLADTIHDSWKQLGQ